MERVNIKGLEQKQPKISEFLHRKINNTPPETKPIDKIRSNLSSEISHNNQKVVSKEKIERNPTYERRESVSLQQHTIKPAKTQTKVVPSNNVNVLFYKNSMPSQPNGEYIDIIHKDWYADYSKLERDHAYIQWIFPNSFQSRFNHHAKPLSSQQAQEFRTNPQIIKRYIKSYDMMLAFYGFKLKDRKTGELARSKMPFHKERFSKTLLTSFHNHMRITRILTSLKETGFSTFALELCKILRFEIYDPKGDMNSLQKYNVYKEWAAVQKDILASPQSKSVYFNEQQREQPLVEEGKLLETIKEKEQDAIKLKEDDENRLKKGDSSKQPEKEADIIQKIERND